MAQAEILSSDLNNAVTRLSKLPSYSTVVGVSTGEIIKTAPISRITAAINNLEAAYSSNCCESDHCQTCQTNKCQSCQNTCTCQSDKNCTNCSYSCQSSGQCTTVCQSCQSSKCESCQDSCTQCSSKCESCQDSCTNCTNCKCESCQDSCTCQSNKQCKNSCQTCQSAATSSNISGYFSKNLTDVTNLVYNETNWSAHTVSFYYLLYYNGSRITNITTARNNGSPVGQISGTADIIVQSNGYTLSSQTGTINGSSRQLGKFVYTWGTSLKNSSGYYVDASLSITPPSKGSNTSSAQFTFSNGWDHMKIYLKKSKNHYIRVFPSNAPRLRCVYNL